MSKQARLFLVSKILYWLAMFAKAIGAKRISGRLASKGVILLVEIMRLKLIETIEVEE